MDNDDVKAAVEAASIPRYMTTKAEIIDYYRDRYGNDAWKSEIVAALMPITGLGRPSLNRRFEGGRELSTRMTNKTRVEYERLGRTLPPIGYEPPPGGYVVEFNIWMVISGECPADAEEREQTITLRGRQALDFLLNPTFDTVLFYYFKERQIAVWCPDAGESWVIVTPAEEVAEEEEIDTDGGEDEEEYAYE